MVDSVEEELALMEERSVAPPALTAEAFGRPIEQLFSKKAISVDISQTVGDAVALMRQKGYGAICVTRGGKLAGIITERDLLLKVIGTVADFSRQPVSDAMTPDPVALERRDPIWYVAHHMHCGGYRHVPIVDPEGVPVSIVSIKDVMRWVLNFFPQQVINAPAMPYRGPRTRESG
jgi:CBS domain-containing protein